MPRGLLKLLSFLFALGATIFFYAKSNNQLTLPLPTFDSAPASSAPTTTAATLAAATTTNTTNNNNNNNSPLVTLNATITRVVDGDTVLAMIDSEHKEFKLRLLGINTPETVDPRRAVECFGKEASNHAKEMLTGKRVQLVADPQGDERDKYDRLLRMIILEDGTNFNKQMVHDGYAYAYTTFPMNAAYKRELKQLQEDARIAKRGLWSPTTCNGAKTL